MMWPFQRKSAWERITEPLTSNVSEGAVKTGLRAAGTVGGVVGVSLVSAAISTARKRRESK